MISSNIARFSNYISSVKSELKNIKHPTKKELQFRIIGVFISCSIFGIFFALIDIIIRGLLSLIIGI